MADNTSSSNEPPVVPLNGFHCVDHINEMERRKNTDHVVDQLQESLANTESMVNVLQATLKTYPMLQKTVWLIAGAQALVTMIITGSFIYTSIVASQSIDRSHLILGIVQELQITNKELACTVSELHAQMQNHNSDISDMQHEINAERDFRLRFTMPPFPPA